MVSIVFEALHSAAMGHKEYIMDHTLPEDACLCKGCKLSYHKAQVMPVATVGYVCLGCVQRMAQMFLK